MAWLARRSRLAVRVLLAGAALAAVAGCAVGPNYVPPELETPDAWELELSRGLRSGERLSL